MADPRLSEDLPFNETIEAVGWVVQAHLPPFETDPEMWVSWSMWRTLEAAERQAASLLQGRGSEHRDATRIMRVDWTLVSERRRTSTVVGEGGLAPQSEKG